MIGSAHLMMRASTSAAVIGGIWTFGRSDYGQLGLGNLSSQSIPVQVGLLQTWRTISSAPFGLLAIKNDGTLWGWGSNNRTQIISDMSTAFSSPVQIGAATKWSKVANGGTSIDGHWVGVQTDGTLWAQGYNLNGQLGTGDIAQKSVPTQVGALTTWKAVAVSSFASVAVKTDGTLWGMGHGAYNGIGTSVSSPVQVGSDTDWSSVGSCRFGGYALKTDGSLYSWGTNDFGQLGVGDVSARTSPVRVGADTDWKTLPVNNFSEHLHIIKTNGTLWTMGRNTFGELGLGSLTHYSSPVQVGSSTTWKTAAGGSVTSILIDNGKLYGCGRGDYGQLGLGDTTNYSVPVQVGSLTTWFACGSGDRFSGAMHT